MKKYIKMLAIMSFISGSSFYADFSGYKVKTIIIRPSDTSDNGIVNEIKKYSDLSKSDEDRWKFLKLILGDLDVYPALAIGGYSAYKAGEFVHKKFDVINQMNVLSTIKEYTPSKVMEYVPALPDFAVSDTLKKGLLVAGAGTVVGLLSHRFLYPRMYRGILNKIENFIGVCSGLEVARQSPGNFPQEWATFSAIAKCNALQYLRNQSMYAAALINYINSNAGEINTMKYYVDLYGGNIAENLQYHRCPDVSVNRQMQEERDLKNRATWWSMARDIFKFSKEVVTTGKDVVGWTIENKGNIAAFGAALWAGKWYLGK